MNQILPVSNQFQVKEDILYTVKDVAKLTGCNQNYVYSLIRSGLLPALKLGSMKVRKVALLEFLEKYEGKDLTDIDNITDLPILRRE